MGEIADGLVLDLAVLAKGAAQQMGVRVLSPTVREVVATWTGPFLELMA